MWVTILKSLMQLVLLLSKLLKFTTVSSLWVYVILEDLDKSIISERTHGFFKIKIDIKMFSSLLLFSNIAKRFHVGKSYFEIILLRIFVYWVFHHQYNLSTVRLGVTIGRASGAFWMLPYGVWAQVSYVTWLCFWSLTDFLFFGDLIPDGWIMVSFSSATVVLHIKFWRFWRYGICPSNYLGTPLILVFREPTRLHRPHRTLENTPSRFQRKMGVQNSTDFPIY